MAICTLVNGVFSSWLTVETMSLFNRSSKWNLVTSSRTTAAPSNSSGVVRIATTRGRK